MLTSALSKAVEKAMESDVEYRRGLPVNLCSFMGSGLVSTYFICFVFANGLLYKNIKQFYHSFPWTRSVVFFALVPLSPPKRLYLFSGKFYVFQLTSDSLRLKAYTTRINDLLLPTSPFSVLQMQFFSSLISFSPGLPLFCPSKYWAR